MKKTLMLFDYPSLPKRIWGEWNNQQTPLVFRRLFDLTETAQACLYICASGDYEIYIDKQSIPLNKIYVPPWHTMRRIPVVLQPGKHELSVQVSSAQNKQPFLLACLDWGSGNRVGTDEQWEMITALSSEWLGDSSEWLPVRAFDGVWAEPTGMPANAPDDFCRLSLGWQQVQQEVIGHVISTYQGLGSVDVQADNSLEFKLLPPFPKEPFHVRNSDYWLTHSFRSEYLVGVNAWLDLFEGHAPHIVLDVDEETFARVRITLRGGGRAILAVTTGESIGEVHRYARRITDVIELIDGESYTTSPIGFRYIKIMALSTDQNQVILEPVVVQHIRYPVQHRGSFSCSDPLLTDIWAIGAHTVHLCMQNEIWDGIKRDQLPWMGDLYTEALAIYHAFGDTRLAHRTLLVLGELGPGASHMPTPSLYEGLRAAWRSSSEDINAIPSYTLWWLVGLADYHRYTGNTLTELKQAIVATLDHIAQHVNEHDMWHFRGGWDYVDWAPISTEERNIFCHLLACQAMGLALALVDDDSVTESYANLHQHMVEAARQYFLHHGVFGSSHHVNAMGIRSGVLTPEEAYRLFEHSLQQDPPMLMTYWHRYADLDAAQRVGAVEWGLNYIRQYWGKFKEVGMTTLWEAFDSTWIGRDPHQVAIIADEYAAYGGYGTSLCHGWSAGPTVWLHTAVLGIRFVNSEVLAFEPNLGDLTWAKGTIPTRYGVVDVSLLHTSSGENIAQIFYPAPLAIEITDDVNQTWRIVCTEKLIGAE
jgi:hypothetical protein